MNKRMIYWYDCWKHNRYRSLYDCYDNPSAAKKQIWKHFWQVEGECLSVIAYNAHTFTVAYVLKDGTFVVETVCNTYKTTDFKEEILDYIKDHKLFARRQNNV